MKQGVLMWVLLILSFPLLAHAHQEDITGYWYHKGLDRTIRIKEKAEVLIVKGLPGRKDSRVFEYIGHATYRDEGGNYIVIKNREQLVYLHKKSREKFRFKKISAQWKSPHGMDNSPHDEWEKEPKGSGWQEHEWLTKNEQNHPAAVMQKIEGSWQTEDGKYLVAILETREGLKAKFSGTTRWVEYTQKDNRNMHFVDVKGNLYTFLNEKEAQWMHVEGNRAPVKLYKISDEVQY